MRRPPACSRMGLPLLLLLLLLSRASALEAPGGEVTAPGDGAVRFLNGVLRDELARVGQPHSLRALLLEARREWAKWGGGEAESCLEDTARWERALGEGSVWAVQMLDSSSKYITGILDGNKVDLGNFDGCVTSTPGTLGSGDDFTGRYALPAVHVQADSKLLASAITLANQIYGYPIKLEPSAGNATLWRRLVTLQFAVCAPSSCAPGLLEAALRLQLRRASARAEGAGLRLRLYAELGSERTSLHTGWRRPRAADWIMLSVCFALVGLVVIATCLDLAAGGKPRGGAGGAGPAGLPQARVRVSGADVLLTFSAARNARRLFTVSEQRSGFTCISGIRFLSALWIILAHRYAIALRGAPFINYNHIYREVLSGTVFTAIPCGALAVDTFFTVGGILNAYAFMKVMATTRSFNTFAYYLHRYIRLTPALLLIVGVTSTWYSLLGSGPLWFSFAGLSGELCRASWWTHPLYLANYVHPERQCQATWYLMVDMQLHWVSPLLLLPLLRSRRLGVAWALGLVALSCAVPFAVTWRRQFRAPFTITEYNEPAKQEVEMDDLYYPTHMRATPYLVGLLVGYYLYLYEVGKFSSWRLKRVHVLLGWLLSAALLLGCLLAALPVFNLLEVPYSRVQSTLFIAFHRLAWSTGVSWVVLACATGNGGAVNAFLSSSPFTVLGRLTYGIYLTHSLLQIADTGARKTLDYFSHYSMIKMALMDTFLASICATILTLCVEAPISGIEKLLRTTREPKKA